MAKIKVQISSRGARAVLNSPEVLADLAGRAERIASAANSSSGVGGEGYVANSGSGKSRARASVVTGDYEAIRDNARSQTLLKNLDRGR